MDSVETDRRMFLMGGGPMATSPIVNGVASNVLDVAYTRRTSDPSEPLQVVVIASAKFTRDDFNASLIVAGLLIGHSSHNVQVDILHPHGTANYADAAKLLAKADMLYIPGGSTEFALNLWERTGLLGLIIAAIERGAATFGHSFGLIAWWEHCLTDSESYGKPKDDPWEYYFMRATGLFPGAITPHADDLALQYTHNPEAYGPETTRRDVFVEELRTRHLNGVAVDGNTTLVITGNLATVRGLGVVTLHIWDAAGELTLYTLREGQSFQLTDLRRSS